MTIQDIENLTFAELKASGKSIVLELGGNELAARYVQARTDARQRDEKLAEQGQTIANLNAALAASRAELANVKAVLSAAQDSNVSLGERVPELHALGTDAAARADRLKAEAERNFKALSTAEKALKDAMAARELDAAERG